MSRAFFALTTAGFTDDSLRVKTRVNPVLLCGGSGTRLWPLSRKSYPKQFVPLLGDQTLFQAAAARLHQHEPPTIVTNSDFRFIVTEQLTSIGINPGAILIEPDGKNTAPAVLAAALYLQGAFPDTIMLVCPSDHWIPEKAEFNKAVETAVEAAQAGQMVTFGISPTSPETGYGYLQVADTPGAVKDVIRFLEKPDKSTAENFVASGRHLWNSGIFMFKVSTLIEAFKNHQPDLLEPVESAVKDAESDLGFLRLAPDHWRRCQSISLDYAVMERSTNLSVVPYSGAWSDLGSWDAVWKESRSATNSVATSGNALAIECSNSLLRSESANVSLVGLGLENTIAIAMNDAVLVADASRSEDVKQVVDTLRARGVEQAENFPKNNRPWGWSEKLVSGSGFEVRQILVHSGAALSLQSHHRRSEHWIVVEGEATVIIDDDARTVRKNQSVFVPPEAKHRLQNLGPDPLILIEVQTGTDTDDEDIVRYDDAVMSRKDAY